MILYMNDIMSCIIDELLDCYVCVCVCVFYFAGLGCVAYLLVDLLVFV